MKTFTDIRAAETLSRHTLSGETMGTRWTAVFYAGQAIDAQAIAAALAQRVGAVDRRMSTWNPASDLMRLNAAPLGIWVDVAADLATVLTAGLRIGAQTGGSFDLGVGDLVAACGFGAAAGTPDQAHAARRATEAYRPASESIDVDEAGARVRKRGDIALDLSGIAKGFGVDELARCLDEWGVSSFLVGIDGEMRAGGTKPGGMPFQVAVERPDVGRRAVMRVIGLADAAIATSGDYRHFIDVGGRRVSHTMDPRLGRPLRNQLASVTVLAATCMEADAYATALMVLGEEAGPNFAAARGMDALFVLRDGEALRECSVGCFAAPG